MCQTLFLHPDTVKGCGLYLQKVCAGTGNHTIRFDKAHG